MEDLVKVTDVLTTAWTIVRRTDVLAALRIWAPVSGGPEGEVLAKITELQRLLNAGEDTEALQTELRVTVEDWGGPGPDQDRTRG